MDEWEKKRTESFAGRMPRERERGGQRRRRDSGKRGKDLERMASPACRYDCRTPNVLSTVICIEILPLSGYLQAPHKMNYLFFQSFIFTSIARFSCFFFPYPRQVHSGIVATWTLYKRASSLTKNISAFCVAIFIIREIYFFKNLKYVSIDFLFDTKIIIPNNRSVGVVNNYKNRNRLLINGNSMMRNERCAFLVFDPKYNKIILIFSYRDFIL